MDKVEESEVSHVEQAQTHNAKDTQHIHVLSAEQTSIRRKVVCLSLSMSISADIESLTVMFCRWSAYSTYFRI
jgi:hypothetical protein